LYKPARPSKTRIRRFYLILSWLAVLGLLAALIGLAVRFSGEAVVVKTKVKTLQEQNIKLNKDLKDAQTAKLQRQEQARIESASSGTAERAVVRSSIGGNCESYRSLVSQYAWNVETALRVMQAESGCNPNALSSTSDRGLMQINWVHSAKVGGNLDALYDPATNVAVAYQVYQGDGWRAWSVCTRGMVACYQ
jgi:soluble lytic murein transglycosylase-like protein